jgi:large conductance mechanosensitive channel
MANRFIDELKEFALRGSVVDLAIGVVVGTAFGKITDSLVKDLLMPPLGLVLGRVDFSNLFVSLDGKTYKTLALAQAAAVPTVNIGLFLNTLINFSIIVLAMFLVVKFMAALKKEPAPADPTTKECPRCFTQIPIKATRCPHCTSELI